MIGHCYHPESQRGISAFYQFDAVNLINKPEQKIREFYSMKGLLKTHW